jgi:predicted negative regulator of RcsB-dependent stress response
MKVDHTEEALSSAIQQFLTRHAMMLALLFVCLCIGVEGYQYWQHKTETKQQEASLLFSQMLQAETQKETVTEARIRDHLQAQHPKAGFATLSQLMTAKKAVERGDYDEATSQLNLAVKNSTNPALRDVARIRLARLYLAQHKPEQALPFLNAVNDPAFKPWAEFFAGTAYQQQGKEKQAQALFKRLMHTASIQDSPLHTLSILRASVS